MSATVTYKGNTLTTINNETKILETAGTWLEGDITIEDETQAESIVAEDIFNATGVECQITGNYSGGTVTQDENGYVILSPSGGSRVASGTYTPASDETNPTIDPNVDSDMLLFYLSPDSNVDPLGNSKRVTYGGLWSKATNKRVFYMASNASGGSWTVVTVDSSQTQPSGTAYNLNTDYLISGAIYQWYAWKIS